MKIGDTLYRFDINRRVYRRNADGRSSGGPIYAEHFECGEIVGETRLSWLCSLNGHGEHKVNKRTMLESAGGYTPYRWFTESDKVDNIWIGAHRQKLAERVRFCDDVAILRAVMAALGPEDGAVVGEAGNG